jgi:hypothetical protein
MIGLDGLTKILPSDFDNNGILNKTDIKIHD